MNEVHRVVRAAAWRLAVSVWARHLVVLATAGVLAVLVLRVVQQTLGVAVDWALAARVLPIAAVGVSIVTALSRWPGREATARAVDRGADLREALSTALAVERARDPWSLAVIESAARTARGVNVRSAVPIRAPRFWPAPMVAALATLVVWVVFPSLDLLGRQARAASAQQDQKKVEAAKVEAELAHQKVLEKLTQAGVDLKKEPGDEAKIAPEMPKAKDPEQIRRVAIRELTSMKDQIEQLRGSAKAMQADAMKEMLKDLKPAGPGPMSDVANALGRGDYKAAQQALGDLSKKLGQQGSLSGSEQQQLAKQLENLQKQMEQLAQNQKAMEDKLKAAGLDPKLAKSPDALAKALEKMDNLSPEQKRQLMNASKASQSASEAAQGMASAMQQMKQGLNDQGLSEQGQQGMQQMNQMMSAAEMLASEAQSLDAAMSEAKQQLQALSSSMGQCDTPGMGECKGGLGDGRWKPGENQSRSEGNGQGGGHGQANGDRGQERTADEAWVKRKVQGQLGQGPVIGSMLIQGEQIRGESRAAFQAAVETASQQASEALESNVIPREYQDAIKHYFGRLQARSQAKDAQAAPGAPSTGAGANSPGNAAGGNGAKGAGPK